MKKFKNLFIILAIVSVCAIFPKMAQAAALSFTINPQKVYAGDVFVAQLNVDSMGQKINVVDGSVHYDSSFLEVQDVSTGGSIFNFWTRAPIYDNQSGTVTFTGGTTKSFSGSSGNVLKIVFLAKQTGQVALALGVDSAVYLADGKGTQMPAHINNGVVTISTPPQGYAPVNQWNNLLLSDKLPPQNLQITIGHDPSVLGGKYFVSFSATDSDSGIDYYAVKEGSGDFVQTESPYVLNNQTAPETVTVKAVNKAGVYVLGSTKFNPNPAKNNFSIWIIILVLVLLLGIARNLYLKIKK